MKSNRMGPLAAGVFCLVLAPLGGCPNKSSPQVTQLSTGGHEPGPSSPVAQSAPESSESPAPAPTRAPSSPQTAPPSGTRAPGAILADHKAAAAFDSIPAQYVEAAKQKFRIYFPRTSHGSQIETGMKMLATSPGGPYRAPDSLMQYDYGDLGRDGNLAWVTQTRTQLDKPGSDRNVVIWPWSGGVRTSTQATIDGYLNAMNQLEQQYPRVTFVYMTGHADQWSVENVRARNQQIREYCQSRGKVLYDFEDIESWDPGGTFYREAGDDCAWCGKWCASHSCPTCTECAHSHCFNCYLKGRAFWWMLARMAGWSG